MSFTTNKDLNQRFDYHPSNSPENIKAHTETRALIKSTAVKLNEILPSGREAAIVLTHLEDALMWANAAIARGKKPELPE